MAMSDLSVTQQSPIIIRLRQPTVLTFDTKRNHVNHVEKILYIRGLEKESRTPGDFSVVVGPVSSSALIAFHSGTHMSGFPDLDDIDLDVDDLLHSEMRGTEITEGDNSLEEMITTPSALSIRDNHDCSDAFATLPYGDPITPSPKVSPSNKCRYVATGAASSTPAQRASDSGSKLLHATGNSLRMDATPEDKTFSSRLQRLSVSDGSQHSSPKALSRKSTSSLNSKGRLQRSEGSNRSILSRFDCKFDSQIAIYFNVLRGRYLQCTKAGCLQFAQAGTSQGSQQNKKYSHSTASKVEDDRLRMLFYFRQSTCSSELASTYPFVAERTHVMLESVEKPGHFIAVASEQHAHSSCLPLKLTTDVHEAAIFSPEPAPLNVLVKVEAQRQRQVRTEYRTKTTKEPTNSYTSTSTTNEHSRAPSLSISTVLLDWADGSNLTDIPDHATQEDLYIFGKLPTHLQINIASYMPGWLQIGRTFSREWCRLLNAYVRRVTISSGSFSGISPQKLYALHPAHGLPIRCSNLRALRLHNIDTLKDSVMERFIRDQNLEILSVRGCSQLTDRFFLELSATQTRLRMLNLAGTAITDDGLATIASSCVHLMWLNLYACRGVTAEGIQHVLQLPVLADLNVRGTALKASEVESFRAIARERNMKLFTGPIAGDSSY